ncbi:FAD-binding oxidoreductase [Thermoleptolyngbya sp. PKUAC-SCTB121]|uniref:NAD(P)/FAD-dependent oxidoreductase n=1 Tax=Thermoleptolyngbya sp. PKUAC-SCTB121 TaxID=2811482 RepID=UPI001965B083|nr:FAD-dependent oxidoreductase [Thermoleptolyngbya sp. PKUAC-SCTB121]
MPTDGSRVVIVGCGVVGAAIAYELSQVNGLAITVVDRQPPARASTGAALGVLMGAISQKTRGRAWNLRQTSLRRYQQWLPELEELTGQRVPVNRQGILLLSYEADLSKWDALIRLRREQGWTLEHWAPAQVGDRCPQVSLNAVTAGIYSPQDCQIDPTALTRALVAGAAQRGVQFDFSSPVASLEFADATGQRCVGVRTVQGDRLLADWVVIASGLGTTPLLDALPLPKIDIRPVLGQAMRVKLGEPMGDRTFQPVITGNDIHVVPLGQGEYWIGATVEFPEFAEGESASSFSQANGLGAIAASPAALKTVWEGAIALCPVLAQAEVQHTWSGLRPRPANRPAPVLERLSACPNVILSTGHYRNGVLLAPATAVWVRGEIEDTKGKIQG